MLRVRWLVLVFVVVFIGTVVAGIPASLVMSRVPPVPVAGAPLMLGQAGGTVWNGSAPLTWQGLRAQLDWQLDFSGITPGIAWQLAGGLSGTGWFGGGPGFATLEVQEGRIPASLIGQVSPFQAEGSLTINDFRLAVTDQSLVEARGELRYSGGQAGWASGETLVPELVARIEPQPQGATARVTDTGGVLMMEAQVEGDRGKVKVYRAWPALLGVSKGGEPTDVVFEASQPIWNKNN